uniref:ARAD1B14432p n=1 Tax=Blastobotrys adeninivorans TaxID=409370 RepID=A0A060TC70_BLAAD
MPKEGKFSLTITSDKRGFLNYDRKIEDAAKWLLPEAEIQRLLEVPIEVSPIVDASPQDGEDKRSLEERMEAASKILNLRKTVVNRNHRKKLEKYLNGLFEALTQKQSKRIARLWIREMEPNKQTKYPYKGDRIPPWWPSHVIHREPDHLRKEERIQLLIQLSQELSPEKLRRSMDQTRHLLGARDKAVIDVAMYLFCSDKATVTVPAVA